MRTIISRAVLVFILGTVLIVPTFASAATTASGMSVVPQTASPDAITGYFTGLPKDTLIYPVDRWGKERVDIGTGSVLVRSFGSGSFTFQIDPEYDGDSVRLRAVDESNRTIAESVVVAAEPKWRSGSPGCAVTASKYTVRTGENFQISWKGSNATDAWADTGFPSNVDELPISGSRTFSASVPGVYRYGVNFENSQGSSECNAYVLVEGSARASFDDAEIVSDTLTPTITGAASGVSSLYLELGSYNHDWESNKITPSKGKWSVEVDDELENGNEYGMLLYTRTGDHEIELAHGTLVPEAEEEGLYIEFVDSNAKVTTSSPVSESYGTFEITFDITAVGSDFYIPTKSMRASSSEDGGFEFDVRKEGSSGTPPASISSAVDSNAPHSNSHFTLEEGETERFTVTVVIDPDSAGNYYVAMDEINYATKIGGTLISERDVDYLETKVVAIPDSVSRSATIDSSSLIARTYTPTLKGTAKGTDSVVVTIDGGYSSAHLFKSGNIPVKNGKWSMKVSPALPKQAWPYPVRVWAGDERLTSGTLIIVGATTTPSTPRDTYRGYLDGRLFIETKDITEADALSNCKLNSSNNKTKSIRCTWGTKTIYNWSPAVAAAPTCSIQADRARAKVYDTVTISWSSKNAQYAVNKFGDRVSVNGTDRVQVGSTGSYTYPVTFYGDNSAKVTCTAKVAIDHIKPAVDEPLVLPGELEPSVVEPLVLPVEVLPKENLKSDTTMLSASAYVALQAQLAALLEAVRALGR